MDKSTQTQEVEDFEQLLDYKNAYNETNIRLQEMTVRYEEEINKQGLRHIWAPSLPSCRMERMPSFVGTSRPKSIWPKLRDCFENTTPHRRDTKKKQLLSPVHGLNL